MEKINAMKISDIKAEGGVKIAAGVGHLDPAQLYELRLYILNLQALIFSTNAGGKVFSMPNEMPIFFIITFLSPERQFAVEGPYGYHGCL